MKQIRMRAESCSSFKALEPNSDISGIGVLWGFLATVCLTLACSVAKLWLDYKRSSQPETSPKSDRWSFALGSVIMGFSDQQVITGISIIVGGVSQLQWGISIYHWQSIVNFAWLSTVTHIMTLSVLRNEIRANRTIKVFRSVAMGILILMLVSVLYPIGYTSSPEIYPNRSLATGFPAWCLYQNILSPNSSGAKPEYNWVYVVVAATFLVLSYVTRVSLLYSNTGFIHGVLHIPKSQPSTYIESKLTKLKEKQNNRRQVRYCITSRALESLYMLLICGSTLYRSQVWEVTWFLFAIAWGIIRVIVSRADSMYEDYIPSAVSDQHSIWGFGQVVAIGLLALPIASFFGAFFTFRPESVLRNPVTLQQEQQLDQVNSPPPLVFKEQLVAYPWYKNLLVLGYILSVEYAALTLYSFPANSLGLLFAGTNSLLMFLSLGFWAILAFVVLWLSTLVFINPSLRTLWNNVTEGTIFCEKGVSSMLWIVTIFVLSAILPVFFIVLSLTLGS